MFYLILFWVLWTCLQLEPNCLMSVYCCLSIYLKLFTLKYLIVSILSFTYYAFFLFVFLSYMELLCSFFSALSFRGLQYGSFPAFAPLNESFPPFFHIHRSHFMTLFLKTDNSTLNYSIENPVPGKWYTASALQYDPTKRIKQKVCNMITIGVYI